MPNNPNPDGLTRLRSETEAMLRASLSRAVFPVISARPGFDAERAETGLFGFPGTPPEQVFNGLPISSGPDGIASAGAVLSGNERGVRVLAKEIKRLISEDKRRGLDV